MAFPPGPLTSMGLWVDRAESFKAMGLKLGEYSILSESVWGGVRGQWVKGLVMRCLQRGNLGEEKTERKQLD